MKRIVADAERAAGVFSVIDIPDDSVAAVAATVTVDVDEETGFFDESGHADSAYRESGDVSSSDTAGGAAAASGVRRRTTSGAAAAPASASAGSADGEGDDGARGRHLGVFWGHRRVCSFEGEGRCLAQNVFCFQTGLSELLSLRFFWFLLSLDGEQLGGTRC